MKLRNYWVGLPFVFYAPILWAEDTGEGVSDIKLREILVRTPFAQEIGTQHITSERIARRSTKNGTISELLHDNLNVQFSNTDGSSHEAGEIAPENVSFHGERFYNNAWLLDGMSNNDIVNPGANNGTVVSTAPDGYSPWDLPAGGTQSFWVNSDIIERADVYDSNISAKYGQFTGGVIDARLKDPDFKRASGSISYRTTRDAWTKYHVDDPSFYEATLLTNQPKFTKHVFSINLNQPISERAALLFSYNNTRSYIPFYHQFMGYWEDQERVSETYVLKGMFDVTARDRLRITALYSPHESKYVKPNIKEGAFTNHGGGKRVNIEWDHDWEKASMTTYIGYKSTQNKIVHAGDNYFTYNNQNGDFDWCSNRACTLSYWGGYGTFSTENKTWTIKQDVELASFSWGKTWHDVSFGWQGDWATASYQRDKDTNLYFRSTLSSTVQCESGDESCIDGVLYFIGRTRYPANDVEVSNNHYAIWLQDKIDWQKWQITLGLRYDYDEFLGNHNIAPRFTASYDVFGDGSTRVFGGRNRYYAASMLAYKLREATGTSISGTRTNYAAGWTEGNATTSAARRYRFNQGLKTPYSDELNLGVQQQWGDTLWTLKWVHREGKDQFARETATIDGTTYRVLNNNGASEADTFTLEVLNTRPWEVYGTEISLRAGANYSKTKSNFSYYDDDLNDDALQNRLIVNGRLLGIDETPETDYNTPWRLFLDISLHFPKYNLNWTNTLNYQAGYSAWDSSSATCPAYDASICGNYDGAVTVYEKTEYGNFFTLDWHFDYGIKLGGNRELQINLDVSNVLDRVMRSKRTASSRGNSNNVSYKLGRQFWLGARYSW